MKASNNREGRPHWLLLAFLVDIVIEVILKLILKLY